MGTDTSEARPETCLSPFSEDEGRPGVSPGDCHGQSKTCPYNAVNVGEPLVGSRGRVQDPPLHRQGETG